jgi:hypothetical protein
LLLLLQPLLLQPLLPRRLRSGIMRLRLPVLI